MVVFPDAGIYELEFRYMPWGILIDEAISFVVENAPANGTVLDLMCGPGYLLGKIASARADLSLCGIDINEKFISHARDKYPGIKFEIADVLSWSSPSKFDIVLCTGGIHHLRYKDQAPFIESIPSLMIDGGYALFADPYIDSYKTEQGRRLAAAELGYQYLCATILNGAPDSVREAANDVLRNDVMGFEYKTSLDKHLPVFRRTFKKERSTQRTWPATEMNPLFGEYGDYLIICRK